MFSLKNFLKKDERLPEPYSKVERTSCPFYGFDGTFGIFMDTRGNQCAMETGSHSPCAMEMAGEAPNLHLCSVYKNTSQEDFRKFEVSAEKRQIFPREFDPPQEKEWTGIKLKQWMDYILKRGN